MLRQRTNPEAESGIAVATARRSRRRPHHCLGWHLRKRL